MILPPEPDRFRFGRVELHHPLLAPDEIRDERQGPDGYNYLAVDSNPGGILRLEPVKSTSSAPAGR